jgi:uncharacterized tellurite resistance protein B-like protein
VNLDEQIQYLANVYHIARADGRVEPVEDHLAEIIARGIGAGYLETRKALDLSFEKGFTPKLPQRLSDRIRCLEDMLAIARRDNELTLEEKRPILDFARQVGITQSQLNQIQKQTRSRQKT